MLLAPADASLNAQAKACPQLNLKPAPVNTMTSVCKLTQRNTHLLAAADPAHIGVPHQRVSANVQPQKPENEIGGHTVAAPFEGGSPHEGVKVVVVLDAVLALNVAEGLQLNCRQETAVVNCQPNVAAACWEVLHKAQLHQ